MKTKLMMAMMVAVFCCLASCDNEDSPVNSARTDFIASGLQGTWELTEIDFHLGGKQTYAPGEVTIAFVGSNILIVREATEQPLPDFPEGIKDFSLDLEKNTLTMSGVGTISYRISDENLYLDFGSSYDAPVYKFRRLASDEVPDQIDFNVWKLSGFGVTGEDAVRMAEPVDCPEICYTLALAKDGAVYGFTYNNEFTGTYRIDGENIVFSALAHTKANEAYDGDEFFNNLDGVSTTFSVEEGRQLKLYYDGTKKYMLFEPIE